MGIVAFLCAWLIASAVRMIAQWEKAVVLQLGKYQGLKGPGLFFIVPPGAKRLARDRYARDLFDV